MCYYNDGDLYIRMASWLCEEYGKLLLYTLLFIYFIIYEYFVNTINNFTEHKYIEKRIRVIMVWTDIRNAKIFT